MMKKQKLRLILEVTYIPNGVPTDQLRDMLEAIVAHAMAEGLVTGDTEAEVDTYTHRIEVILSGKIKVPAALKAFFEAEIRNENEGGVRPACLGSAKESWEQAPENIQGSWCDFAEDDPRLDAKLGRIGKQLDALIAEYGPDLLLETIVN